MTRWVLHVDLDQFIAAVEMLRRPELRGLPIVVGGDGDPSKRGVVSTASYAAREYGVHSGLPLRTAVRRCPDAVFLPVDHETYDAASVQVMAALRSLGTVVEVMGWDEAFLAVDTDDPQAFAREVQTRVREATSLECTVGIGQNKLQAKLATGFGKPAGVFTLTRDTWFDVLGERPTEALWGIGRKTAKRLAGLGIHTVRQLAETDPGELADALGPTTGPWLVRLARGGDHSPVVGTPYVARGRSREHTFQHNLEDWDEVRREVARLARMVAEDMAAEGRSAARVVAKVRFAPFTTHTHGQALPAPTSEPAEIERAALAALDKFTARRPVRLVGVRAELVMPEQYETV
jgi:nucleotidyltransferase/DNA polymerase involved in DNA repair